MTPFPTLLEHRGVLWIPRRSGILENFIELFGASP
jgi:hypothetical protein